MYILGVDIGGTKTNVCLATLDGKILLQKRFSTSPEEGFEVELENIESIFQAQLKEKDLCLDDIEAIGISCPGPINSKKGLIVNPPNLKGWENTPIVEEFTKRFKRPTFLNNDANAAALAEYHFGARKGVKNLIYLTASTGMGAGIIEDGKLIQGATDTAGEVGHYVLDIDGPMCACGQKGCFEVYCGGLAVAQRAQEEIRQKNIKTCMTDSGLAIDEIDMEVIIAAAKNKDSFALKIWDEFVERLAQGIGTVIMTLNPEAIILGTIAIHAKEFLMEPLLKELKGKAWSEARDACIIEPSALEGKISALSAIAVAKANIK